MACAVRILVSGSGRSGSWQIRGEQLGRAIGATVRPNAYDVKGFDAAIVVKRAPGELLTRLREAGVPVIWDVVDAWPQPLGNEWAGGQCRSWLEDSVQRIAPAGIVAATRQMALDCQPFGVPVLYLPHHARPGQRAHQVREKMATVGYEGGEQHLGRWRGVMEAICARRGLRFVVNPQSIADLDVVVALRERTGYAPRMWKSNVKLANAQDAGVPFIGNREAGYLETASGTEHWADSAPQVEEALDALEWSAVRRAASARMKPYAPQLMLVAGIYRRWLESTWSLRSAA